MRNKIKTNKSKTKRKIRKKRTTIKDAFENGYRAGYNVSKSDSILCVLEIIDKMIEEYNDDIQRYPRNTKFVELQLDSIAEFKRRLAEAEGKDYIQ
jgi:hypothetical protein